MNVAMKLQDYKVIIVEFIVPKIGFVFIPLMKLKSLDMFFQMEENIKRIQLTYNESNIKFVDVYVKRGNNAIFK